MKTKIQKMENNMKRTGRENEKKMNKNMNTEIQMKKEKREIKTDIHMKKNMKSKMKKQKFFFRWENRTSPKSEETYIS
jgi:hypothetical protein